MIQLQKIGKQFQSQWVLRNISGQIMAGEVLVLLGPSGSGKSTLLRCLNGLELPTEGQVCFKDQVATPKTLPFLRTKMGMVFQQFNLFPHFTLLENISYAPLKVKRESLGRVTEKAKRLLREVGLEDKANVYPHHLSGGQKQRGAIARALMMDPEVILFDEPTSALDPERVKEVLNVMKSLAHTGITLVIVTHEMAFAREVADHVWFLDEGQLIEVSPASSFFEKPQSMRAQSFLNSLL